MKTKKIVVAAMLAALTCVATLIINIPSPLRGNMNMGDSVVLVAGWMLSPVYGFLAAGIGSALADVFSGYVMYVPATFIIKGVMALVAGRIMSFAKRKTGTVSAGIISGIAAELVMVSGYFVFEGFLYGFVPSLANIPLNGIQGIVGLVLGIFVLKITDSKSRIPMQ